MANVYFGDYIGQADQNWNTSIQFTVSLVTVTPTAGATYTNNGITFKVTSASITAGSGTINAGGTGTAAAAGVLTKVSGTGDATIAFSAKADVNWFSTPGFISCCCCCSPGNNNPGTPLGRLPTLADSVIVNRTISIGPDITPWTTALTVTYNYLAGSQEINGVLNAGTFSGAITNYRGYLGGTIVCNGTVSGSGADIYINGGTFNGAVSGQALFISGGTFASSVTNLNTLNISGSPTFNGTIVNSTTGASSLRMAGSLAIQGTPNFNCAIPSNFSTYTVYGGTYDRDLTLGLFAPTVHTPGVNGGSTCTISIQAGLSTSRSITLNSKGSSYFFGTVSYGSINVSGGVFTGLVTINRLTQTSLAINGGSYTPPAVTTPSIKSGNDMTFTSAAIPTDWGFRGGGGTFNPTVLLSGTSNDIIGSGLP
jgi:hypothetical protein